MKKLALLPVIAFLVGCSGQLEELSPEQMGSGDYDALSTLMTPRAEKLMRQALVKGVSISVVDGQQTVWETGIGMADVASKKPADEHTVYRYGSIGKLFTTVAILDLVEQGLVDLNASIQTYIPNLKVKRYGAEPDTIRVHHLLTHHSGLHGDMLGDFMFYEPLEPDYTELYRQMPELLSQEYVQTGTDSLFSYCNNAFTLLGVLIYRVTGQDYSEYMAEHVFQPLGMEHSSAVMTEDLKQITATGYQIGRAMDMPYIRDIPAGSILSNASDMAKFMKMFFNEGVTVTGDTLLNPETVEDIFISKNDHIPLDRNFKIGWTFWLLNPYDREFMQLPAGHGGDLPPYHAILIMLPGEELGVTAVTNSNTGANVVMQLAMDILAHAYEIKYGVEVNSRPHAPEIEYDEQKYSGYQGLYPGALGLVELKANSKGMNMKLGGVTMSLVPRADDWFSVQLKLFGFIPVGADALANARVSLFKHADNHHMEFVLGGVSTGVAGKIEARSIPESWMQRVGKYERINLDREFSKNQIPFTLEKARISYDRKSGLLLLEGKLMGAPAAFPLRPLDDQLAVVDGLGRMAGQGVRVVDREGTEILLWSGLELKAIP